MFQDTINRLNKEIQTQPTCLQEALSEIQNELSQTVTEMQILEGCVVKWALLAVNIVVLNNDALPRTHVSRAELSHNEQTLETNNPNNKKGCAVDENYNSQMMIGIWVILHKRFPTKIPQD